MATMTTNDGKWVLVHEVEASGLAAHLIATQNTFVDKNIEVQVSTPAGALQAQAGTAAATSNRAGLITESVSQPSTGAYITVTAKGLVKVATSGWLDANTEQESNTDTKYYSIANATFSVDGRNVYAATEGYVAADAVNPIAQVAIGQQTVTGGALSAGSGYTAVSSDGYYDGTDYDATDKVALTTTEAQGYYKLTSVGKGTVNSAAVTKQVTSAGFFAEDVSPVEQIAASSLESNQASAEYFVKKSTMSATEVTSSNVDQTVTISDGYAPANRTVTVRAMTEVTPTTSLADTGVSTYFNAGTSADHDVSLTPQYSNAGGYVAPHTDTNNGGVTYLTIKTTAVTEGTTTVSGTTVTRGTATWGTGWIETGSMSAAAFKNSATSGVSYVDISGASDAPVLVSGDYLYIDKGYVDNLKISLARLVPDGTDVKGHSEYILQGHSAIDEDGTVVAGSIPTFNGAYDVA